VEDGVSAPFELTVFAKDSGPLTKRIRLGPDGTVVSDGSACVMTSGTARRVVLNSLQELADLINALQSNEAIALGALRDDLPEEVRVTTKNKFDGAAGVIVRTQDFVRFRPRLPAFALLDFDAKGMPPEPRARIADLGGFWGALTTALPGLCGIPRVVRPSTSAGLFRIDTGEEIRGAGGVHAYLPVKDGNDIGRFLTVLHQRCWLVGLGWLAVGRGGQLLERSIVDRMVRAPERLVFEGAPMVIPPLAQDLARRRPAVVTGVDHD